MSQTASASAFSAPRGDGENHAADAAEFQAFRERVSARFLANVEGGRSPLFTTDAEGLWEAYLAALPEAKRQEFNCHACRFFVERFGGLVTIDASGVIASALWDAADAPAFFGPFVAEADRRVRRAAVTGVFLSSAVIWGKPQTGEYAHLAVTPPLSMVFGRATQTAGQARAEKREDVKAVQTALAVVTPATLEQALKLLETESLYRSEKVLGQAQWLANLHTTLANAKSSGAKDNLLWRAVATAPAGFCHPRSSMIGTLLLDIAEGMDFGEVSRRFAAKMHPLQYQRPQAAPSAGAIAAAEKIVAQLKAAGSLARRFCRVDEVEALWKPTEQSAVTEKAEVGGVFGHLLPTERKSAPVPDMKVPPVVITWEKFARTVLPDAEKIEYYARDAAENYAILLTAVHADAPPILQWDREDTRNPVSSYVWHGGSRPEQFGLTGNAYHRVVAVTLNPSMWGKDPNAYPHQGKNVTFLLDGARESRRGGVCLFPEIMKADFHGVRSVIEAYSRSAELEGMGEPGAIGINLSGGGTWNARFRVTAKGRTTEYKLDRWD